jgi:hypothetical protein
MGLLCFLKIMKTPGRINPPVSGVAHSSICIKCLYTRRVSDTLTLFCTLLFLLFAEIAFAQESLLDKVITIPKQHTTLYNALNLISDKAGCLFIYDSQVVESDKHVKLVAENQSLKSVLDNILGDPEVTYKVMGQHILLYRVIKGKQNVIAPQSAAVTHDSIKSIIIRGHIYDSENKSAVPFASIGIVEENIGTITNMDGYFTLKIPASYAGSSLVVSHIGFMSQHIPIKLINEQKIDLFLERRIISLQEVIIRYIDPHTIIAKAMQNREVNNNHESVYTTSFYREGVEKNNRYISYSEAVFKIYKSPYTHDEHSDQVKLLKSRKVEDSNPKDTVFLKLKAGILSALQLDIVKCVPDFLDLSSSESYIFTYSDVVSYSSKDAYVITFIQKRGITDPLFTGTLYIDKENYAILGADFEINPAFLDKAAEDLVLRKSRRLNVTLEKISYSVSYTPFKGKYFLSHARCDIKLKTRLRHHLSSDNFNTFLELATCNIDTVNVVKFSKEEVIKPNVVFSDAQYTNDDSFWGDYNSIAPEEKVDKAISKIIGEIEKIGQQK